MDITTILAPFVPASMLVAALVALVRKRLAKLGVNVDGWWVLALAAVSTVAVCLWSQLRAGSIDWTKLLVDAPAVFVLAAGGAALVTRVRDGEAPAPAAEHVVELGDADIEPTIVTGQPPR
jgi:hypothetical protein